jgi:restriction system protein
MAIPAYKAFMLPLLEAIADGQDHAIPDVTSRLASRFNLDEIEREEMLPSGQQTVVANRVAWAKTYLKKAGLLVNPERGRVRITDEGQAVLRQKPTMIDRRFLEQYPSFKAFVSGDGENGETRTSGAAAEAEDTRTPEEAIEDAYLDLRNALADDVLDRVKACSPQFFESLVVRLLVAMGYGGSLKDAGEAVGRTGDDGIDGIIKEDMLGLDVLCVQAKRWDGSVGRPIVQAFAGSMEGFRARKGVLITTSTFSKDAREYVSRIERKIVLIDGKRMAQLMIDHNIGVTTTRAYVLKRPDSVFFEDVGG